MEITPTLLRELFNRYNEEYFEGLLPANVKFSTYEGRRSFGMYLKKGATSSIREPEIRLVRNVEWEEENLKSVILHEMCHHYVIAKNGGKSGHNIEFFRIAKRISKLSNINVVYPPLPMTFSDGRIVKESFIKHILRKIVVAVV